MAWENLPTNYTNAEWSGLKRYQMLDNEDGTISLQDVTVYSNREKSFFGARDANAMNGAINDIMDVGIRGINLLHNWYFVRPVNRKGMTSYETSGITIDRWSNANDNGIVMVHEEDEIGLSGFSGDMWFRQFVDEPERLYFKTVTISAIVDDKLYYATGTVSAHVSTDTEVCIVPFPGGSLALYNHADGNISVQFHVIQDASVSIKAVKLELGSTQTLARESSTGSWVLFEIPEYAAQFSICSQFELATGRRIGYSPIESNAGNHNSIYRGKSLGRAVTDAQWTAIENGTFDDMFIGDYWTIVGVVYRIAAFNYYLKTGDITSLETNHVTLVPDAIMYKHQMNDTNITTGAYVGSKMYTEGLTEAKVTINNAFGEAHVLKHRQFLQNAVTDGYASGGSWYDSTVALMTEHNVYGGVIFGNMLHGTAQFYSYIVDKSQYPLFTFRPDLISNRQSYWLRDVASASSFAHVSDMGNTNTFNASNSRGVRPAFSIC
jgi:hypothetical protein